MILRTLTGLLVLAPLAAALQQSFEELPSDARRSLRDAVLEAQYGAYAAPGSALEAANPAQGMRTSFTTQGIQVVGANGALRLRLEAWGRPGALRPAAPAELYSEGRRVELRRGAITEWYVNDARGLEQGFTVAAAPAGEGPLELRLSAGGGHAAELAPSGRDVRFRAADGSVAFHYTGLEVLDAAGRELAAMLAVEGDALSIRVDDAAATYPLVVDPWIWVQATHMTADDTGPYAYFGTSTSLSGDTLMMGVPGDDAVVVFEREAGLWLEQATLRDPTWTGNVGLLGFGRAVAVQGDRAVITAQTYNGTVHISAAYAFERMGSSWVLVQEFASSDLSDGDDFGEAVALDGDVVVIGADNASAATGPFDGAAYVFRHDGTAWVEEAKLESSDASPFDSFGDAVAIEGDTIVVGASRHTGANSLEGAAYVFVRTAGVWNEVAKLQQPVPKFEDYFGGAVAISAGTVMVGSTGDDQPQFAGSVYVFEESGGVWGQVQKLRAIDKTKNAAFGGAIALEGDRAVIGSPQFPPVSLGTAYVFERTGSVWSEQHKLVPSNALAGRFGDAVGLSGGTIAVGAPRGTNRFGQGSGTGYVYEGSGAVWSEAAVLDDVDAGPEDLFGCAVAVSGDTALVGAEASDIAGADAGAAFVFRRNSLNKKWWHEARLLASDAQAGERFGRSVGLDGDTALVGADLADGTGSAYVFQRTGTDWAEEAVLTASDAHAADLFGGAVSIAGDTALVGAPGHSGAGSGAGAAYVFLRAGTLWSEQAVLTATDAAAGDELGGSVSVDADTALVGASGDDPAGSGSGSAYVFERSGVVWSEQARLEASDGAAGDAFGTSVSFSGFTALVGASGDDDLGAQSGSAYVFVGGGTSWSQQEKLLAADGEAGDRLGTAVALSGNVALLGAPGEDDAGAGAGAAYGMRRVGSLWNSQSKITRTAAAAGDEFGAAVAVWNGYGVVGARSSDTEANNAGSAYAFSETATPPVNYCTAGTSASGCKAIISTSGTPSATAPSGFVLTVANMEGAKDGLFFYGTNGRQANPWGNGTSYVCVIPPRLRGGLLVAVGSTAGFCDGVLSQDLNARWCPTCPSSAHNPGVGVLMQAQMWYRDPQNTSNQTSSMSDAIEFVVEP